MARLLQDKSPGHVYWKNLDRTTKVIFNKGSYYTEQGQLIYWMGNEASLAQQFLDNKYY